MRTEHMTADEVRKRDKPAAFQPHDRISYTWRDDGILVIDLPALPPSKNSWIRKHWRTQQRCYFKPWARWVAEPWWYTPCAYWRMAHPQVKGKVKVSVQFFYPDKRRRDGQNYFGWPPLFDSLVTLGVIDDDSGEVCLLPPIIQLGSPGTRITIEPVEGVSE